MNEGTPWSPPKGVSLDRLEALVRVDGLGSIAAAAGRHPVRQSQVSRQLRELGEALGVPLTRKEGRSARLTPAGVQLAALARGFLKSLGAVGVAEGAPLVVALGAGDTVLQALVVPAVAAALRRHPTLRVSLRALPDEELLRELDRETLDAVLVPHAPPRRWAQHRLSAQTLALYAPARAAGRSVEEVLAALPLALQTSDAGLLHRVMQARRGQVVALRCETFSQAREAVRSGAFATVLPTFMELTLKSREVRRVGWPALNRKGDGLWWAQSRSLAQLRPAVGRVLAAVREAAAATAREDGPGGAPAR